MSIRPNPGLATNPGLAAVACATFATLISLPGAARSQSFAHAVAAYRPGPGVKAPFDDPRKALGPALGAGRTSGSLDVVTLGEGGSLSLSFRTPITDGPGADFLVFENSFIVGLRAECYAELAFVEVSSDGVNFARFPVSYVGPQVPIGPFGSLVPGTWSGCAGSTPVHTHPTRRPDIDPRDPARTGGDAFDLAVLRDHPLVRAQKLNIFRVTHIRLVDVVDGKHRDAKGRLIRDPSLGSADIDGITVINEFGKPQRRRPIVELKLSAARRIQFTIGDPDGFGDLRGKRLGFSIQGDTLDLGALLSISRYVGGDTRAAHFESLFSVPRDFPVAIALSATDRAGLVTGASLVLH